MIEEEEEEEEGSEEGEEFSSDDARMEGLKEVGEEQSAKQIF